jgi:hypothetical protein
VGGAAAAWLSALVALLVALGTLVTWGTRIFYRVTSKLIRFLDDYNGQPGHDGIPARPGVQARLARLEAMVAAIVAETKPNGGTSMRDVVHQTGNEVMKLRSDVGQLKNRVEQLGDEAGEKPLRGYPARAGAVHGCG